MNDECHGPRAYFHQYELFFLFLWSHLIVDHLALAVEVVIAGRGGILQGGVGKGGAKVIRRVGVLIGGGG